MILLYDVFVDERVQKDLAHVPGHIVDRFIDLLDLLEMDPIHRRSGADIKRLKGHPGLSRARIGDYRVLFYVDRAERVVKITSVVHRKKAYR